MKKTIKILTLIVALAALLGVSVMLASAVDAPQKPEAVTVQPDFTSITLSWNACEGATGYRVFQAVGGKWVTLKTTGDTSYTITGLTADTYYRFAVRPYAKVDGVVYWAYDYAMVLCKTSGAPQKPSVVNYEADFSEITLSWDVCEGATGYRVFQAIGGKWVAQKTTGATSCTVTGLTAATSYNFAVRTYVKADDVVYWSTSYTTVDARTLGEPLNPASVKVKTNNCTAVLSWDACANATGYRVFQSIGGKWVSIKTTAATEHAITGLKADTSYTFAVRPYLNYEGTVYWAKNYTTVTAKTEKADVLKITESSDGSSYIRLSWKRSPSASGYAVFQRVDGKWNQLKNCSAYTDSYTVENLYYATEYEFCVRSYIISQGKTYWNSTYSYIKAKTKDVEQMSSPNSRVLEPNTVKLTWSSCQFTTGYRVFYRELGGQWIIVGNFTDEYECQISGLKPSTTYHFAVRPYEETSDGIKWHSLSRLDSYTTQDYTKVNILTAKPESNSIALTWEKVPGATGYRIYNRVGSSWVALKTVGGTEYTLTGLESDTVYNLAVRAYKKVDGVTQWYTVGPIKKVITHPGEADLVAYRYKETLKFLTEDDYYIDFSDTLYRNGLYMERDFFEIGCKGENFLIDSIIVENEDVDILYTGDSGNMYLIIDKYKRYTIMEDLEGFEWNYYASVLSSMGFYNHNNKITVSIKKLSVEFDDEFNEKYAVCEQFTEPETGYTYYTYYVCDELVGVKVDYHTEGYTEVFEVNSITSSPSASLFKLPSGYTFVSTAE